MKICLVNSFYPPWIGGAERYVSSLSRELVKRGNDVTVYCSGRPLSAGESLEDGVRIRRMSTPMLWYGTPLVVFPRNFFSEKYDVIHANFPSPFTASMSAWNSELRSIPSVLTWHNDLPAVTAGAGVLVKLHASLSLIYLNQFRRIIATTQIYAQRSVSLRRYADKVVVIPNGVDTGRFRPDVSGDRIREEYGLQGLKVVLFVGALTQWHAYKGLDVLLKAFRIARGSLPEAKLLIVGDGEMRGAYQKMTKELGIEDSVIFAGRADDATLPLYYGAADVLVLPSKDSSEGFGLVLLEAMSSGKAVIGSLVGGIPEVITDEENGLLVEPLDPAELSKAIVRLCTDDSERTRMGASGRRFAESRDWRAVAEKVETLYETLVN